MEKKEKKKKKKKRRRRRRRSLRAIFYNWNPHGPF